MKNLWNENEAKKIGEGLPLRVYSSRLLGQEPSLVLHGGGNTSVKVVEENLYGEKEEIIYIKGSGWDLKTIEAEGFSPVRLSGLLKMTNLSALSDKEMVKQERAAMTNPDAPTPSVEAILHALIPFKYVDHTHADAVVTITNSEDGLNRIKDVYGNKVIIVPYVMPGFVLAKKIHEITKDIELSDFLGIVLMHHGVFTFSNFCKESYDRMVYLVSEAEAYLEKKARISFPVKVHFRENLENLATLRKTVSMARKSAVLARIDTSPQAVSFSSREDILSLATRGTLTPDHVIRTKPFPLIVGKDVEKSVQEYQQKYREYYERNKSGDEICLDLAPRWAIWPGHGVISFGVNMKEASIISDIKDHTLLAMLQAETLGGFSTISEKDLFDMEYWELEQAKLKKSLSRPEFEGKIVVVTGAASGIGKACVEAFHAKGATVAALDVDPSITTLFSQPGIRGGLCDITDVKSVAIAVKTIVLSFGGIDILVSNAGVFPPSEKIKDASKSLWKKSLDVNLIGHQNFLQHCLPYLERGIDPAVVFMGSKNVHAPGPGVAAYSVAKAALTQLARVAAIELASLGIRVNVIHPNQVFDTKIWTPEILEKRAKHYGMSVEEYKINNLLKTEITSKDVSEMVCAMAGKVFSKVTGAQIPFDGGNERII